MAYQTTWYHSGIPKSVVDLIEKETNEYFDQIDSMGGVINCIENGFMQKEIADASVIYNNKVEN